MSHPNILFIMSDQLIAALTGAYGHPVVQTPNLDRLAAEGIRFDSAYTAFPLCAPGRACLMTGRHPGRFGRHATVPSNPPVLPDGYETLAGALRNCGYDTGLFGKWHLGSDPKYSPNQFGFNHSYGSLAGGIDPYSHRYKEGPF
ncbi:MAG: sulfatase-like hydrolase/transferase, partial [Victivallales bacterium]|nr:sulfatase-like hydrolase/transferase [Victivallales bacterium]